jgi:iron complex transport system substrate-binding protein
VIIGNGPQAQQVVADIDRRPQALRNAPTPPEPPTIFLFDSGTDAVFSSGRFGASQAIISAAWERVAASNPDAFAVRGLPAPDRLCGLPFYIEGHAAA